MVQVGSIFASLLVALAVLESSCQPANITHCFSGSGTGTIGASPGNAQYLSLKCFDAVGTNTNACNMTALGFSSTTDMFSWCLAGPPYINLLGCCSTCANKINENKLLDANVSFALLSETILAKNLTCFNGIEGTQFSSWPTGYGCGRLAASNPSMCSPKTFNMCKFAFFNCRAYCHKINPTFGWCHYLTVGTDK